MHPNILIILLVIIQMTLSYNVYYMGNGFYESRIKNNKTKPKVFDIAYKYLPDLSDYKYLEYFIDILVAVPVILIFFFAKAEIYKQFSISFLLIHLLRSIFIHSTILPKTKDYVHNETYNLYNIIFGHCYDKIFSGHFATTIISSFFLFKSGIITNQLGLVLYNLILALALLLNRAHYTIDLLVAILASYAVITIDKSYISFIH